MKIYLKNSNEAIFESEDAQILLVAQGLCDGIKVRCEPRIIFPVRALPKIAKAVPEWHKICSKEALDKTIAVSESIKNRKRRLSEIRNEYTGVIETPYYNIKSKYTPFKHQLIMFKAMAELDRVAILADPGTCKTAAYLWAIDYHRIVGHVKKSLVVTLSHLKENVMAEMAVQAPDIRATIITTRTADNILNKTYKQAKRNQDYDLYIANYESMFSLVEMFPDDYFQMVILDEAHRIGFPRSRQTKAVVGKFENVPYKYIVTGTLNANSCMSFFMPFRFLGPDTVPMADFNAFRTRYFYTVDPDGYVWKPDPCTPQMVKDYIGRIAVCFRKEECLDLPPKVYEKIYCDMAPDQLEQYNLVWNAFIFTFKEICDKCLEKGKCGYDCSNVLLIQNVLVQITKLSQISSGFFVETKKEIDDKGHEKDASIVHRFSSNPKADLLISTLNNIPPDRQVIIWSNYVSALKDIHERMINAFGPDQIITCWGGDDAFEKVNMFKNKKYFLANQKKAGTGLNIQFSNYQIFFSNTYSYVNRDQAESRQDREGQKNAITVIDLLCKNSMDKTVLDILMDKKQLNKDLTKLAKVMGLEDK